MRSIPIYLISLLAFSSCVQTGMQQDASSFTESNPEQQGVPRGAQEK
jgi:hypothetical protein